VIYKVGLWFAGKFGNGRRRLVQWRRRSRGLEEVYNGEGMAVSTRKVLKVHGGSVLLGGGHAWWLGSLDGCYGGCFEVKTWLFGDCFEGENVAVWWLFWEAFCGCMVAVLRVKTWLFGGCF